MVKPTPEPPRHFFQDAHDHVDCRDDAHARLLPVEPLDVEIGESETLLPAGTVSSILEGTIVVQVPSLTQPFILGGQLASCLQVHAHEL